MTSQDPKLIWMDAPFEDLRNQLVANFETHPHGADPPEFVTVQFFFTKTPGKAVRGPVLRYKERTPLNVLFETGERLTGTLTWQSGLSTPLSQQVLGALALQEPETGRVWRFQGFMSEFGKPSHIPSPDSGAGGGADDGGNSGTGQNGSGGHDGHDPDQPNHTHGGDGDNPFSDDPDSDGLSPVTQGANLRWDELFPFIYMKHWPSIAPGALDAGFMEVPQKILANSVFLQSLVSKSGDRSGQEALAVTYVDPSSNTDNTPGGNSSPHPASDAGQSGKAQPAAEPGKPKGFISSIETLGPPFSSYPELWPALRELPEFSLAQITDLIKARLGGWAAFKVLANAPDAQKELARIWESIVALNLLAGWQKDELAVLIQVLTTHHVLTRALAATEGGQASLMTDPVTGQQIKAWMHATLVLPGSIFEPKKPAPVAAKDTDHQIPLKLTKPGWVRAYSYGLARSIRYQPLGYELGDVQRIENVLRGEMRETRNRRLQRRESHEAHSDVTTKIARRDEDTSVSDLINQVQKTLADHVSTTHVNSYDTQYGMPTDGNKMSVTGNWWVQEQPAGGFAKNDLKFARDIVEKTVRNLSREMRHTRELSEVEETEYSDVTRFDNRRNGTDIRGIYRWVNRSFRLRTKSLGEVLIFEIMVPSPGENLVRHIRRSWQLDLRPPKSPGEFGISGFQDLTDETGKTDDGKIFYLDAFQEFGVEETRMAPPFKLVVSQTVQSHTPVAEGAVLIPRGFEPIKATATVMSVGTPAETHVIVGSVALQPQQAGDKSAPPGSNGHADKSPQPLRLPVSQASGAQVLSAQLDKGFGTGTSPADEGHPLGFTILCSLKQTAATQSSEPNSPPDMPVPDPAPMHLQTELTGFFAATLEVTCQRSAQTYSDWQFETYRLIKEAYARQLEGYRRKLEQQVAAIEAQNPAFLNKAMTTEILSAAQEQILTLSGSEKDAVAPDYAKPRIRHYLQQTVGWSDIATFMDIEDEVSDLTGDPADLALRETVPDLRFRDFLRADRVRILAPVDRKHARSFLYFLRTGRIWPDADHLAPCLPEDAEIVARIKSEHTQDDEGNAQSWTVQVPTHMCMLSADSDLPGQTDSE
ncbi:hypothetical protein [Ruegeria faecimaris]|uniref:hypothetical protein n=1 Tax=Ruegeria faecimaris TaxID=686389 RepID=UPI0024933ABD|nr:hypothetical protein [Ruegeria faecimaris]